MKEWRSINEIRYILYDESIIIYSLVDGKIRGGSDRNRQVRKVEKDSDGYFPGGEFTMELDLWNRSFAMQVDEAQIIIDAKIAGLKFSPIVILSPCSPKITLV